MQFKVPISWAAQDASVGKAEELAAWTVETKCVSSIKELLRNRDIFTLPYIY
jgi:hypothetical protein